MRGTESIVSWLSRLSLNIHDVSTHTLNISTLSTEERNAPFIPISEERGLTARFDKNGEPQIAPVTFLYNAELDTIDIGGLQNGESQKFRNVARNGLASFVVDDVLPPFQPRGIEIRGRAQALPDGGQRISPNFSPALIRLIPGRIISWNLTSGDPAQTHLARNV